MGKPEYRTIAFAAESLRAAAVAAARQQYAIPGGDQPNLSGLQKRQLAEIDGIFAGVPAIFYPFMDMPTPQDFAVILKDLQTAVERLSATQTALDPSAGVTTEPNTGYAAVTTVGDHLADWSGAAAREFKQNYLDVLPIQSAAYLNIVSACVKLIEQEQAVWREAHNNVLDLIENAVDVLQSMYAGCGSKDSWTVLLTVVAAVATIAGPAVAVLGTSLAVGVAGVDAAASVGESLLSDDPPKNLAFKASTPQGVIQEVERGVRELILRIHQQESKIAAVFSQMDNVVNSHRDAFVPGRPLLARATGRNFAEPGVLGFPI